MKSDKAKSLQKIGGISMLKKICATAAEISSEITLVVGYQKESIINESEKYGYNISYSFQEKALGTGDAVQCGMQNYQGASKVLILYGDVPLIKQKTLEDLINKSSDGFSILTTHLKDPYGYGRVKKDKNGFALCIVEEKDASQEEKSINEVFTGVMCVSGDVLMDGLKRINNNNAAGEYYLTDLVSIISKKGIKIRTYQASYEEVKGANDKLELEQLEKINRDMKAKELLEMGVTIVDSSRIDIRGNVEVGKDCYIDSNVILEGSISLGDNVHIGANTILKDVRIGNNSKIEPFSHIDSAKIGNDCVIGPYARLREGSLIEDKAKVGNFVETKNTVVGSKSKANHLTYLGDTDIGKNTNIGAGTITCNYDGKNKHKTSIGSESFIGSNTALVAPVTIGSNSTVAAGSVITKDVPDNALGFGRAKQENKENWSKKKD